MCRVSCLLWLVAAAVFLDDQGRRSIAKELRSPEDQFLQCASETLGRPVLRDAEIPWVGRLGCLGREELRSAMQNGGVTTSDAGDWMVLHRSYSDRPHEADRRYRWKRLRVAPSLEHQPHPTLGLPLTDAQVKEIGERVVKFARPVPPSIDTEPTEGDTLVLRLRVTMDRVRLKPGVDSVVVLTGFERTGRFVYGELREGHFVPLWDTPMMASEGGPNLSWTYRDMDGDGVPEVLASGAANPFYQTLVVFNLAGEELTRNHDCFVAHTALVNTNPFCPLMGEEIEFEPASAERSAPLNIITKTRDGNERFCLRSEKYELCNGQQ